MMPGQGIPQGCVSKAGEVEMTRHMGEMAGTDLLGQKLSSSAKKQVMGREGGQAFGKVLGTG
jgi:hypothetical protein